MKNILKLLSLPILLFIAFYACQKESPKLQKALPVDESAPVTQSVAETRGDTLVTKLDNGVVLYDYPDPKHKPNNKDWCCDVYSDGHASINGNCQGAIMYFFRTKFTVTGATAYRYRVTLHRNSILVTDTYTSQSAGDCSYWALTILYTQGQCSGTISVTVSTEYQIGTTWYTCDADHDEFLYNPPCANPCE